MRSKRSKGEFHAEVLEEEGPLVGGFFDDFAGGFARVMTGARLDVDQDRGGALSDAVTGLAPG